MEHQVTVQGMTVYIFEHMVVLVQHQGLKIVIMTYDHKWASHDQTLC